MARGKKKESALTPEEKLAQALVPDWEQPYKVPENWCWTRLMHVAKWGSGGTPSRRNPAYYEGCIPWIKTGELNDDYIYETEEHKLHHQMAAFCFSACKVTYHYEKRRVFAKQCGSFFREMVYYFFINILSCLCAVRADLIGRAQYGIPHGT